MNESWRFGAIILILILCLLDLMLTYYYINKYRQWQPEKPYKLMERNPLLVMLWNKLGLHLGMFVGAVALLTLTHIVAKEAHWIIVLLLIGFLIFALFNHQHNISLLWKLIDQYPSGHLPEAVFGIVEGNNPK